MRKIVLIMALCLVVAGCQKKSEGDDYAGGNMQYDAFRGASSSLVNRVQLEAFDSCLRQFDFTKYRGNVVEAVVYAANDHVKQQITTLVHIVFIKNGILTPEQVSGGENPKPPPADYVLELHAICGGYHFYPGIVFYNYRSTARVVMVEQTPRGESRFYDSDYRETSLFKPVFTDEFRVALYIAVFSLLGWAAFRLGAWKSTGRKNPRAAKDGCA